MKLKYCITSVRIGGFLLFEFLVCVVFPLLVVTVKIVFTVEDVIIEFFGDPP